MTTTREQIESVLKSAYPQWYKVEEAADQILALIEEKYLSKEKVRKEFWDFNEHEKDFECNLRVLKLRNSILLEDHNKN